MAHSDRSIYERYFRELQAKTLYVFIAEYDGILLDIRHIKTTSFSRTICKSGIAGSI